MNVNYFLTAPLIDSKITEEKNIIFVHKIFFSFVFVISLIYHSQIITALYSLLLHFTRSFLPVNLHNTG